MGIKVLAVVDLIGLAGLLTLFVMAIRPRYESFIVPVLGGILLWLFFAVLVIRACFFEG